jgi:hypothetical protein
MKLFITSGIIFSILLPILGIANPTISILEHRPLHPGNGIAVTFNFTASSLQGIKRIVLSLKEYNCIKNPDGSRGTSERNGSELQVLKEWTFNNLTQKFSDQVTYQAGFIAHSLVKYTIEVQDEGGSTYRTVSMQAGDSPYGNEEILLYSTSERPLSNVFQICFIPDKEDFGSKLPTFLDSLQTTIYRGYLSSNMIGPHSQFWAFYYTPSTTVVTTSSNRIIPSSVRANKQIDAFALMHNTRGFQDRAGGKTFSSESFHVGTVVHETSHVVFNLNDERTGSGSVENCNVFRNAQSCKTANGGVDCRSITVDGKVAYVPESREPNCIMNDDGDKRLDSFRTVCQRCIEARYATLVDSASNQKVRSDSFSLFQTEEIIIIKLAYNKSGWQVTLVDKGYGKPSINYGATTSRMTIEAQARGSKGKLEKLHSVQFNNPRVEVIHTKQSIKEVMLPAAEEYIRIPYNPDITTLQLKINRPGSKAFTQLFDVRRAMSKLVAK